MGICKYDNFNNQSGYFCNIIGCPQNNIEKNLETNSLFNGKLRFLYKKDTNEELTKENLEKNLSSGSYLGISDYNNLMNQKILNYIESHKLNYQDFIPTPLDTYKSKPIKYNNGNIYHGNWNIEGEMEGYGIYLIKVQNLVIEGIWKKGNIIYGRIFFPNGDLYEGFLQNYYPHGKGTMFFANKDIYKGDFINGEMSGIGIFTYADKSYFSGKIKNGLFNGEGIMKWINGNEYHGNFLDSFISGNGEIFNNIIGEKYIGTFDKNEFNGNGTYSYKNGDIYQGNFEYGIKKGKGIFKRHDKVEFDVIWDDDLPNGNGVVTYNNNKLNGFWRNGNIIRKDIKKENENIFNGIDLNIKPIKRSLYPGTLPHLNTYDSQCVMKTEWSL